MWVVTPAIGREEEGRGVVGDRDEGRPSRFVPARHGGKQERCRQPSPRGRVHGGGVASTLASAISIALLHRRGGADRRDMRRRGVAAAAGRGGGAGRPEEAEREEGRDYMWDLHVTECGEG
jgi:hypothetical protein